MTELLERDQFLTQLDSTLSLVAAGTGRTVLVGGEAGIGKTSLVERFADRHRGDARVLWGACEALFTPRPLGPLHDIAAQTDSDLLDLLESDAPRSKIFAKVLNELQPGRRPPVAVLEDVHWADEATLDLIKFLGRRINKTGALLILTYRDDEVGLRHPLRSVIGELPGASVTRLTLDPLSEAAVETLARRANRSAQGIHAITGGNPFFVTEILASDQHGVPSSVRDAVLTRASRLSEGARRTLDAAAVIGARVELWLLDAVAGTDAPAAEEAVSRGLMRSIQGGLGFRHELARQAILDNIPPGRARALHKGILEALTSSPAGREDLARLAHHAEEAGEMDAVLECAPEAGDRAAALGAHREAAAQYARALRFAHALDPLRRARLLESYAQECALLDRPEESINARRSAVKLFRAAGDSLREGELLARLANTMVVAGQNAEGERTARLAIEVLERLPPGRELATAYRIQATLRMLNRDTREAVAWGEKALSLARQFGATEDIITAHNAIGSALLTAGNDEGLRYLETSRALAQEAGRDIQVAHAYVNLGSALGEQHRFREADQYLAAGIGFASERDFDQMRNYMVAWRALVHLYLGRWNESADDASDVLRRPGASAISRIMAFVALGRLRSRRGDPEVKSVLDEALQLSTQTETLQRLAPVRAARAEAAWLGGDVNATRQEAQAAFDLAMRHEHSWFVGELAYWRFRAGDLAAAPEIAAEPFRLEIQGDWREAADAWERIGCPYEKARALADGDEEAQRKALAIFEGLGAGPAGDMLRRSLRAQGIRDIPRGPRAATKSNPAGLSARELEVLTLLGEGLPNAEIASRLYLSAKTIDHHVSAILAKLSARSRGEAVAAGHRLGIITGPDPKETRGRTRK